MWNANGILNRKSELAHFLRSEDIDIALISETHLNTRLNAEIWGYKLYTCHHPSGSTHGGSAIYIKQQLQHNEGPSFCTPAMQCTVVSIRLNGGDVNIAAIYSPPWHNIKEPEYATLFAHLGHRWILGGDFNAKHPLWGSRITTPKGSELYKCINSTNAECCSKGLPTYWPTDPSKKPDCIKFFLLHSVSSSYTDVSNMDDLSSDHSPIILTLSDKILYRTPRVGLTNKHTDWDEFRRSVSESINLRIRLKTLDDIDQAVLNLQTTLINSAKLSTPAPMAQPKGIFYPKEIQKLVKEKRAARRRWQNTRDPSDKAKFNRLCKETKKLIAEVNNKSFKDLLYSLGPTKDTNYSLWKMSKIKKRPPVYTPPLRDSNGTFARSDSEKADLFAVHLENRFQPYDIPSDIQPTIEQVDGPDIPLISPKEIQQVCSKLKLKHWARLDL